MAFHFKEFSLLLVFIPPCPPTLQPSLVGGEKNVGFQVEGDLAFISKWINLWQMSATYTKRQEGRVQKHTVCYFSSLMLLALQQTFCLYHSSQLAMDLYTAKIMYWWLIRWPLFWKAESAEYNNSLFNSGNITLWDFIASLLHRTIIAAYTFGSDFHDNDFTFVFM